ncbi:MAG: CPBP family intramembrane metalloprotease [Anaerolineaceae bacterium]|nr:CPBP family intramembrane metalloprotease [Anaerolineaceae bacterium]
MNSITSFIKRFPQAVFWAIAWSTFFFGYFMYLRTRSEIWQLLILGPFLGGILVTGIADGRSGLKTYFARIVRWRVPVKWYAVALFLPFVLRLAAFGLTVASGAETIVNPEWAWGDIFFNLVIVIFVISLGEEPGFRGFALPRLLNGRSALTASLILGVFHAIWHLPLFITGAQPPIVFLVILAGAVLNTWLFNNTNGSVLLTIIMHTSVDFQVYVFNPLFTEADAVTHTYWLVAAYVATAVILLLVTGKNLSRKQEIQAEQVTTTAPLAAN